MRLFFAFPVHARNSLEIDQWRSKAFAPSQHAIPLANFHITIAFIGQVSPSTLDSLCSTATAFIAKKNWTTFELILTQSAYWPKPQITWIGPTQWPQQLDAMAHKFASLQKFGSKQSHKKASKQHYQPHISLFRGQDAPLPALFAPNFHISCNEIVLYESVTLRRGVRYDPLESWLLPPDLSKARARRALPCHRGFDCSFLFFASVVLLLAFSF